MKILKTERLELKNFRMEDVYPLYQYRSLSLVEKYQSWKNYRYDDAYDLIVRMKDQVFMGLAGIYQWGIYLHQQLIGDLFWEINHDGTCWIGYTLNPSYWHQGYGQEAVQALVTMMHERYHIQVFMAYILKENRASIALIRKCGFKEIYPCIYLKKYG